MFVAEFRQREGFVARVGDDRLVVHGLSGRSGQRGSGEAPPAVRDFLQLFDREFRFRRRRSGHFDHDLIGDVGERFAAARPRGRGRHRGFIGVCAGRIEHVTARVRHGPFVRQLAFSRADRGRRLHAGGRGLRSGRTASRRVRAARGDRDHSRGGERSQPYPHGWGFGRSHSSYLSLLISTAAGFGSGGCG